MPMFLSVCCPRNILAFTVAMVLSFPLMAEQSCIDAIKPWDVGSMKVDSVKVQDDGADTRAMVKLRIEGEETTITDWLKSSRPISNSVGASMYSLFTVGLSSQYPVEVQCDGNGNIVSVVLKMSSLAFPPQTSPPPM